MSTINQNPFVASGLAVIAELRGNLSADALISDLRRREPALSELNLHCAALMALRQELARATQAAQAAIYREQAAKAATVAAIADSLT